MEKRLSSLMESFGKTEQEVAAVVAAETDNAPSVNQELKNEVDKNVLTDRTDKDVDHTTHLDKTVPEEQNNTRREDLTPDLKMLESALQKLSKYVLEAGDPDALMIYKTIRRLLNQMKIQEQTAAVDLEQGRYEHDSQKRYGNKRTAGGDSHKVYEGDDNGMTHVYPEKLYLMNDKFDKTFSSQQEMDDYLEKKGLQFVGWENDGAKVAAIDMTGQDVDVHDKVEWEGKVLEVVDLMGSDNLMLSVDNKLISVHPQETKKVGKVVRKASAYQAFVAPTGLDYKMAFDVVSGEYYIYQGPKEMVASGKYDNMLTEKYANMDKAQLEDELAADLISWSRKVQAAVKKIAYELGDSNDISKKVEEFNASIATTASAYEGGDRVVFISGEGQEMVGIISSQDEDGAYIDVDGEDASRFVQNNRILRRAAKRWGQDKNGKALTRGTRVKVSPEDVDGTVEKIDSDDTVHVTYDRQVGSYGYGEHLPQDLEVLDEPNFYTGSLKKKASFNVGDKVIDNASGYEGVISSVGKTLSEWEKESPQDAVHGWINDERESVKPGYEEEIEKGLYYEIKTKDGSTIASGEWDIVKTASTKKKAASAADMSPEQLDKIAQSLFSKNYADLDGSEVNGLEEQLESMGQRQLNRILGSLKKADYTPGINSEEEREKYLNYIKHGLQSRMTPNEIKNDLRNDGLSEEEIKGLFEKHRELNASVEKSAVKVGDAISVNRDGVDYEAELVRKTGKNTFIAEIKERNEQFEVEVDSTGGWSLIGKKKQAAEPQSTDYLPEAFSNWLSKEKGISEDKWFAMDSEEGEKLIEEYQRIKGIASKRTASLKRTANDKIMRTIDFDDIAIGIEWPKDTLRRYSDGYSQMMKADYGFVRNSIGSDGEDLDVYLGDPSVLKVFRIEQLKPETGEHDEYKYMVGFHDLKTAVSMFLQHMPLEFFGGCEEIPIDTFRHVARTGREDISSMEMGV